jgi:renalase
MNATPHLAVIGAGLAGLSCAAALQQAGLKVTVCEKSRGVAGRMSTRRGEDWQCDHGAQYFTARHPDFRAEVERWARAGVAGTWAPRLQVLGGSLERVPDAALLRFVGIPAMTAPARDLAQALSLAKETTITQLQRAAHRWQLLTAERGWLVDRFDAVLLATPAPQAAALLRQPAPELAARAGSANMRGGWALMLRFAAPVELPFDGAFVNEGPLRWIARNNSKPGRGGRETWLLHATAEWSEAHLEQNANEIAASLLPAFCQLGGPPPQAWTAHRWRYADTEPALDTGYAWEPNLGVGMCGDWLNGGKVEGAWLSGRALAQQVLQSFGAR